MKVYILLLLLGTTSLVKQDESSCGMDVPVIASTVVTNEDSSTFRNFVNDFEMLKEALKQHDIKKAQSFFNFPLIDENNEIWFVALSKKELETIRLKKAAPFTKKNFTRHFDRLFPVAFTKALLEIMPEKVYAGQDQETSEFRDSTSAYRIHARYDRIRNTLTLNVAIHSLIKEEEMGNADGNVIYYFNVLPDGHFQFNYIRIAG